MNGGGGSRGGVSPDAAYAEAKTSVWWDIENCMVPRRTDPNLIAQNISTALACAGFTGPISISAYGDTGRLSSTIQHALSSTGISLHHVPAGIKDASDKKILVDMLFWAIDNPPPANILLISGDRDFCNALHKLRMRRYNILLAHAPSVSQTLVAAAKTVWHWKSLAVGEPPLSEPSYVSSFAKEVKDDDVAALETVQSAPPSLETLGLNDQKSELGGTRSNSYPFAPQTQTTMPAPQSSPHSFVPSNRSHDNPYEPQPNMQPNMNSYNPTNSYNNSYMPHNPIPSAQNFGPPPPNNHDIPSAQNFGPPPPNNHNMHYGTTNPNWPGGSPYPTPAPSGNFSREPTYYPPNPNHPYPPQNYHDYNYRPVQHVPPPVPSQPQPPPVPPARKTTGTSTGGTVPNQRELISVVLRALSILKKEKITSNKANISDCIHFGEISMPLFNAKSALKAAVQHNVVVKHLERKGSNNNTFYVPKNGKMWNCVNVMDIDVKISKKTLNELTRFLSSSEGRNELMASQGRYHAAIILKKSCLETRTLGDVLQILNNLISVNKWIIPNSSSGWQPLSFNLSRSDSNLDSKPVNCQATSNNSTGTGTGTVPNQPKTEVQFLISVILRALSILKKEKITSNEANISDCIRFDEINIDKESDCIRFGEIKMPTFNAKSALEMAVQQNVVVKLELESKSKNGNNNTFYVPKNKKMWNCVNVMDIDLMISKKELNELTRFLSSSESRDELIASQGRYHVAIMLKKSCLKTRTLGDMLQILNNLISVRKWIIPNSSSGWQPLSFNLNGSDSNLDSKPVNSQPSSINNQATSSNSTGWDD